MLGDFVTEAIGKKYHRDGMLAFKLSQCAGRDQLLLGELLLQQHLAVIAKGYQVKGRLAKINSNGANLHVDDPP
jgi:hypothetical protein